jgi:hypothetical protein
VSETKFANNDINKNHEWTKRIESELLALKMEKKTQSSMSLQVIGNGINKDGDILKADSLVVPTGKAVTFLLSFCSIYQDFAGNIYYPPGLNASLLTAESDYLVWNVLGINAGTWYPIELNWTAGSKRTYVMQWVLGAGTYSNLKLYARIEEQNATPQRRSCSWYAFWIACMTIYRTGGWTI